LAVFVGLCGPVPLSAAGALKVLPGLSPADPNLGPYPLSRLLAPFWDPRSRVSPVFGPCGVQRRGFFPLFSAIQSQIQNWVRTLFRGCWPLWGGSTVVLLPLVSAMYKPVGVAPQVQTWIHSQIPSFHHCALVFRLLMEKTGFFLHQPAMILRHFAGLFIQPCALVFGIFCALWLPCVWPICGPKSCLVSPIFGHVQAVWGRTSGSNLDPIPNPNLDPYLNRTSSANLDPISDPNLGPFLNRS
jgi:hypothetical protein